MTATTAHLVSLATFAFLAAFILGAV